MAALTVARSRPDGLCDCNDPNYEDSSQGLCVLKDMHGTCKTTSDCQVNGDEDSYCNPDGICHCTGDYVQNSGA